MFTLSLCLFLIKNIGNTVGRHIRAKQYLICHRGVTETIESLLSERTIRNIDYSEEKRLINNHDIHLMNAVWKQLPALTLLYDNYYL